MSIMAAEDASAFHCDASAIKHIDIFGFFSFRARPGSYLRGAQQLNGIIFDNQLKFLASEKKNTETIY